MNEIHLNHCKSLMEGIMVDYERAKFFLVAPMQVLEEHEKAAYLEKIPEINHRNFTQITENLHAGLYLSIQEFVNDVELCLDNSKRFCRDRYKFVYNAACTIQRAFRKVYEKLLIEVNCKAIKVSPIINSPINPIVTNSGRVSRGTTSIDPIETKINDKVDKIIVPSRTKTSNNIKNIMEVQDFRLKCSKIIDSCSTLSGAAMLQHPVDPAIFPDYLFRIAYPIDFTTIRNKLSNGIYLHHDEFSYDMRCVFGNFIRYNFHLGASIRLRRDVTRVLHLFETQWLSLQQQETNIIFSQPFQYLKQCLIAIEATFKVLSSSGVQKDTAVVMFIDPINKYFSSDLDFQAYVDIIGGQPMDLSVVISKIICGDYKNIQQVKDDISLIANNCETYWTYIGNGIIGKNEQVFVTDSRNICDTFINTLNISLDSSNQFIPNEVTSPNLTSSYSNKVINNNEEIIDIKSNNNDSATSTNITNKLKFTISKNKIQPSSNTDIKLKVSNTIKLSHSDSLRSQQFLYDVIKWCLEELKKHYLRPSASASKARKSLKIYTIGPFLEPVDDNLYPDYATIVVNPMNISYINLKLEEGGWYTSVQSILDDIYLIRDNAYLYNVGVEGLEVRLMADAIVNFFKHLLRQHLVQLIEQDDELAHIIITKDVKKLIEEQDTVDVVTFLEDELEELNKKQARREKDKARKSYPIEYYDENLASGVEINGEIEYGHAQINNQYYDEDVIEEEDDDDFGSRRKSKSKSKKKPKYKPKYIESNDNYHGDEYGYDQDQVANENTSNIVYLEDDGQGGEYYEGNEMDEDFIEEDDDEDYILEKKFTHKVDRSSKNSKPRMKQPNQYSTQQEKDEYAIFKAKHQEVKSVGRLKPKQVNQYTKSLNAAYSGDKSVKSRPRRRKDIDSEDEYFNEEQLGDDEIAYGDTYENDDNYIEGVDDEYFSADDEYTDENGHKQRRKKTKQHEVIEAEPEDEQLVLTGWELAADSILKIISKHPFVDPEKTRTVVSMFFAPIVESYPALAEEYLEKIKNPMDLMTLRYGLYEGTILTMSDFYTKLISIFQNSVDFNQIYTEDEGAIKLVRRCKHLVNYCKTLSLEMLPIADIIDENHEILNITVRDEEREKRLNLLNNSYINSLVECRKLIKDLERCKTKLDRTRLSYFSSPVNEESIDDYSMFVRKPMDLATVKVKLEGQANIPSGGIYGVGGLITKIPPRYNNYGEFINDLRIIFVNALKYNKAHLESDDTGLSQEIVDAANLLSARLESYLPNFIIELNEKIQRANMISEENILTEEEIERNRMEMNIEIDDEEDFVGEVDIMKDDEEYEDDMTFVESKVQQKADKIVRQKRKSKIVQEVVEVIHDEENHYVNTGAYAGGYEMEMEPTANQRVYSQSYQGISIDLASIQAEKLLGIDGGLHVPYIPVVYAPFIDLMLAVKKRSWDMFLPLAISTMKENNSKSLLSEEKDLITNEIKVNKRKRRSFDDEVLVGIGVDIEEEDEDDESHIEEVDDEDSQANKRSRNNDYNQFKIHEALSINNVDQSEIEDTGWCHIDKIVELSNKENENMYNIKIRNKKTKTKKNYRNNLFNHFEQVD